MSRAQDVNGGHDIEHVAPSSAPVQPNAKAPTEVGVTRLLDRWRGGDQDAQSALFEALYDELRRLARFHMAQEQGERTLQPTALVNESFLRLVDADVPWESRSHFLAIAARVMRQILVESARERGAQKRGGDRQRVTLRALGSSGADGSSAAAVELLALHQALERLAEKSERQAQIIELRLFAGMTIEQTCEALDVSHATVERDARVALAWLRRELETKRP